MRVRGIELALQLRDALPGVDLDASLAWNQAVTLRDAQYPLADGKRFPRIPRLRGKIAARLDSAGMRDYPALAYAEPTPARINFLIDPEWGGETPRTLVIRADGSHAAISGELTAGQLERIAPH